MKNFILTCFLALPCLFGSSMELRKVAQSPLEPPLHRSAVPVSPHSGDTHRGEETLSDTFTQLDNPAETSVEAIYTTDVSAIDGGPALRSAVSHLPASLNFGLINPDQDMGAGEGTSSLQPAPVTVFLVHRIPESAGNLVVDLWDAKMYGLENFDNHQRMEIAPMAPHMLTGLMPREERGYKFQTPSISTPSIIQLSLAHYPMIQNFRVSPGDSVMIKVDEKYASVIFTGPSAPKFRIQKELKEVVYEFTQGLDIGLSFSSEQQLQAYLDQPGNREAWDSISTSFGRKTILKVSGEAELEYLKGINIWTSVSAIRERVGLYKDKVSVEDLEAIYAEAIGNLFQIYIRKLSSAYNAAKKLENPKISLLFQEFIQDKIAALSEVLNDTHALDSPGYRDYLIGRNNLKANISNAEFFEVAFESLPQEVADRITVQYLSDIRKKLSDFEEQAASLDTRLKSPEMRSVLAEMMGRFGQGAPLFSFDLPTLDGNRITLQEFEGKALLIDFWITGCGACKSFHERIFDPLIEKYSKHPDLKIISICADRKPDYWIQQGGTPDVSYKGFIPAYAERSSDSNPLLSHYNIHSYPQMMLVRPDGTLFRLGRVPATLAEAESLLEETLNSTDSLRENSSTSKFPDL